MLSSRALIGSFVLIALLGLAPVAGLGQEATPVTGTLPAGVEVVASGLTNPRGFTWDANGNLYLALAGTGGSTQVAVEGTPLPFFVGASASIARVEDGCAVPLAEGIGSLLWTEPGWIWGAMDVAVFDGQLYALLGAGSGEAAVPGSGNGIYRVNADGTLEQVADLAAWLGANPPEFIPFDYDPTGSWFDLEAGSDRLWVSEAVGGRLLTVTPDGQIAQVADLSTDHMVPTGVALDGEGGAFVNHETVVPFPDGAATVIHVAADGTVSDAWTGLTAGTDLVMGPDGVLYAAEMATGNVDAPPFIQPGTGQIVRQTGPDSMEPVVTGIDYPVYLGFGPDGALYVTYPAFGPDAGAGQGALLRLDLTADLPIALSGLGELAPTCGAATGSAATIADPATASVTIIDFAFDPRQVEAATGETVTWTNQDWAPHTVTADDGGFDSGRIDQGGSFSQTFGEPGTYAYFCAFHPGMTGTVVVQ